MNWQDELRIYFEKEDYEQCIKLLKKELTKPFCNDEDLSLNLMYVYMYMYILKKSDNTASQMIFLSESSVALYKIIMQKYANSAKAFFYTAYNASIAEWIFDFNSKDLSKMYHKALLLEPNNKLYRYGYYTFALNDRQKGNIIYEDMRNDENCLKEIEKMSILGDYLIKGMEFLYTGEPQ